MRIIFLLVSSLIVLHHALAQDSVRRPLLYANLSGHFGSLSGAHISAALIVGKRSELSIGYELHRQDARNMPSDIECWSCKHGLDMDVIDGATLSYGYVLYPHFLKGFSRVILRTGLMLGMQSIPDHFQKVSNPAPFADNYTYTYDRHFAIAWIANPSLDIALGRVVGLTIGPYAIANGDFQGAGISFGAIIGSVAKTKPWERVREAKQKKPQSSGEN